MYLYSQLFVPSQIIQEMHARSLADLVKMADKLQHLDSRL